MNECEPHFLKIFSRDLKTKNKSKVDDKVYIQESEFERQSKFGQIYWVPSPKHLIYCDECGENILAAFSNSIWLFEFPKRDEDFYLRIGMNAKVEGIVSYCDEIIKKDEHNFHFEHNLICDLGTYAETYIEALNLLTSQDKAYENVCREAIEAIKVIAVMGYE